MAKGGNQTPYFEEEQTIQWSKGVNRHRTLKDRQYNGLRKRQIMVDIILYRKLNIVQHEPYLKGHALKYSARCVVPAPLVTPLVLLLRKL